MIYSTFLGGNGVERITKMVIDQAGNAYIAGGTTSCDFPISSNAFDSTCDSTNYDGYIFKLNSSGTAMIYGSYFGGNLEERIFDVTVDDNGYAYIFGATKGNIVRVLCPKHIMVAPGIISLPKSIQTQQP